MLRLSHAIRNGRYCRLGTEAQLGMDVIRVWAWMLWWSHATRNGWILRLSHAIRNGRYCRLGTKAQLGMDFIRVWAWMLW